MLAEIYLLRLKMMVQATAWPAALALATLASFRSRRARCSKNA